MPANATHLALAVTLFAGRDWFDNWLGAFGGEQCGYWTPPGAPDGLAIAYRKARWNIGPLKIAIATGASNSHTPRFDTLRGSATPGQLQQMMRDLDVSMLDFPYLSRHSRLLSTLPISTCGFPFHLAFNEQSPFVDCRGSWDEYWAGRSKKARQIWGPKEKKLQQQGMRMAILTRWDEIKPVMPLVYAIEASGWKGQMGTAIVQGADTRTFYDGIIRDLALQGRLYLFLLYLEDRCIAFQLTTLHNGVMSSLKNSYLEEHSKLSPGAVLLLQLLRWAFQSPEVAIFDMLGGGIEPKSRWATGCEDLYRLRVFRTTPAGLLAWGRLVAAPYVKARLTSAGDHPNAPARCHPNDARGAE